MKHIKTLFRLALATMLLFAYSGSVKAAFPSVDNIAGTYKFTANVEFPTTVPEDLKPYLQPSFEFTIRPAWSEPDLYFNYVTGFISPTDLQFDYNQPTGTIYVQNNFLLNGVRYCFDFEDKAFKDAGLQSGNQSNFKFNISEDGTITIPTFSVCTFKPGTFEIVEIYATYSNIQVVSINEGGDTGDTYPSFDKLVGSHTFSGKMERVSDNQKYDDYMDYLLDNFTFEIISDAYSQQMSGFLTTNTLTLAYNDTNGELKISTNYGPLATGLGNIGFSNAAGDWSGIGAGNTKFFWEVGTDGSITIPEFTIVDFSGYNNSTKTGQVVIAKYTDIKVDAKPEYPAPDEFEGWYKYTCTDYNLENSDYAETCPQEIVFQISAGSFGSVSVKNFIFPSTNGEYDEDTGILTFNSRFATVNGVSLGIAPGGNWNGMSTDKLTFQIEEDGTIIIPAFTVGVLNGVPNGTFSAIASYGAGTVVPTEAPSQGGEEEVDFSEFAGTYTFKGVKTDYEISDAPIPTTSGTETDAKLTFTIDENGKISEFAGYTVDPTLLKPGSLYNQGMLSDDGTEYSIEMDIYSGVEFNYGQTADDGSPVDDTAYRILFGNGDPSDDGYDAGHTAFTLTKNEDGTFALTDLSLVLRYSVTTGSDNQKQTDFFSKPMTTWTGLTFVEEEIPSLSFEASELEVVAGEPEQEGMALMKVSFENSAAIEYAGYQFDITLPKGVSVNGVSCSIPDNAMSISKSLYNEETNTWRVIAFEPELEGSGYTYTGEIALLSLSASFESLGLEKDEYPYTFDNIEISKIYFSTVQGEDIEDIDGYTGSLTVVLQQIPATEINIDSAEIAAPSFSQSDMVKMITLGESVEFTVSLDPEDTTTDDASMIEWTIEPAEIEGINFEYDEETGVWTMTTDADVELSEAAEITITGTIEHDGAADATCTYPLTIKAVLLGDANANDKVTVADVVTTANVVAAQGSDVKPNVLNFCYPNANVVDDENGNINIDDVMGIVDIILYGEVGGAKSIKRHASTLATTDRLVADNFRVSAGKETVINVCLDNSINYTGLQAFVNIPEGMKVTKVTKGARAAAHDMAVNISDSRVGVVLYSLTKAEFADSNDALFQLHVVAEENCEGISIDGIRAVDPASNGYNLAFDGGMNETGTTGINGIDADEDGVRYFDVNGIEIQRPDKGIYIRINKNGEVEKVVK